MAVQQRAEETRGRILSAAVDCFAQRGYDATSVAELCDCAGVSKGAFYHHFPTKQSVFLELLNRWLETLDTGLDDARSGGENVPDSLRNMAGLAGFIFSAAGEQLPMFLEFLSQASHDPEVWKATVAPYLKYRDFFAELVRQGIAEGSLRPVDADMAARAIVSLAMGVILQGLLDPEGADWGLAMQGGIQMLLLGIAEPAYTVDSDEKGTT
jgi:AcrR family transcriptional regulator